jgi:glycerol-3-phosphate dehydrogenase
MPLLKAMNLVTARDASADAALGGRTRSGRHLFMVPWHSRALFGTWESPARTAHDDLSAREEEVGRFIGEINQAFPSLDLRLNDVALVHRGVVPAVVGANGGVSLEGHERIFDHSLPHGGRTKRVTGILSVAGVKYTTARRVAERVTDRLAVLTGRKTRPCTTAEARLPGGDLNGMTGAIADARRDLGDLLPSDALPHLIAAYGSRYREVVALAGSRPEWRTRLVDTSPVVGAELVWAFREEMAQTLADAVIRRTPLGALGYPGDQAAQQSAAIMAAELGWTPDRTREEVNDLRAFYAPVPIPNP